MICLLLSSKAPPALDIQYDTLVDFVGDPFMADLVLFLNGNQFMVMSELLDEFRRQYPSYPRIFYETLPPGLLAQQIETGGRIQVGTLDFEVQADIYTAGRGEMVRLGDRLGPALPYAQNQLSLVVSNQNPMHVQGLQDLGKPQIRVAMPNPQTEGIARLARHALVLEGGEILAKKVFEEKALVGETRFTTVHHRQTIPWVVEGQCDVGVVWQSEAYWAQKQGQAVSVVDLPKGANPMGQYWIAGLTASRHPEARDAFLDFIQTSTAQAIYRRYGFEPVSSDASVYSGF